MVILFKFPPSPGGGPPIDNTRSGRTWKKSRLCLKSNTRYTRSWTKVSFVIKDMVILFKFPSPPGGSPPKHNASDGRSSSTVERPLNVRWVVGSIPHDGLNELFSLPASAPRLVHIK